MKTIIHVNQHAIRRNIKASQPEPVLTVKNYKSNNYAFEVEITGPAKIIYSPHKPLSCGARVWIETEHEVHIIDNGKNSSQANPLRKTAKGDGND